MVILFQKLVKLVKYLVQLVCWNVFIPVFSFLFKNKELNYAFGKYQKTYWLFKRS
jgi:hypothetical protein